MTTSSAQPAPDNDLAMLRAQLAIIAGEGASADPWTRRARPMFLYVMYLLLLSALPIGVVAAVRPDVAAAISAGVAGYFKALPEPLYALFGTGYLGYTAARQWRKIKGVDH